MIEYIEEIPYAYRAAARGHWQLSYQGKLYFFATEAEAQLGLRLHQQAERVITDRSGKGHA